MTQTTWEAAVRGLRSQREHDELVREAYYDDPLDACAQRYRASTEWSALRGWLPTVGRALEIGAGRGIASFALAKEGFDVVALEPDESPLVGAAAIRWLAGATRSNIEVVVGTSEHLPLPPAHFDLVFARAVLHHTRDLDATCREVFRVLKPGGRFIAVREHVLSSESDLPRFLAAHPLHRLYGGENAFVLSHYLDCIERSGLEVETCLKPFESAINFAPRTENELRKELLRRIFRLPWLMSVANSFAVHLGLWPVAFRLIGWLDRRPGRLYSFVCRRPS